MENPAWLFVIASAITVMGIVMAFRQMVNGILSSEHTEGTEAELRNRFSKEYNRFFIRVALIEAVPIILIAFGIIQIMVNQVQAEVAVPLALVLLITAFGWVHIYLTRMQVIQDPRSSDFLKRYITTSTMITFAFVGAFPLISVMFFIMVLTDLL